MPLNLFYTMVQKSQKWPKLKSRGGSCLKEIFLLWSKKSLPFLEDYTLTLLSIFWHVSYLFILIII